jgi:hypothetical protein
MRRGQSVVPWTTAQEEILYCHAREGAAVCARMIADEYGIERTEQATERHMQRLGLSAAKYEICVRCGARVSKVSREGECQTCRLKAKIERMKVYAYRKNTDEKEVKNEVRKYEREYANMRARKSKEARKGL